MTVSIAFRLGVRPPPSGPLPGPLSRPAGLHCLSAGGAAAPPGRSATPGTRRYGLHCLSAGGAAAPPPPPTQGSPPAPVSIAFRLGVRPPPSTPGRGLPNPTSCLHCLSAGGAAAPPNSPPRIPTAYPRVSIAFRLGVRPPQAERWFGFRLPFQVSIAFRLGVRPPQLRLA